MAEDLSNLCAVVFDAGLFAELAIRLAREKDGFGKVYYYREWKENLPVSCKMVVGDGFTPVKRVKHFHDILPEADIAIFPDVMEGDRQQFLEDIGIPVWGAKRAEDLELDRVLFKDTVKEVGLPVGPFKVIEGLTKLREHLKKHEDLWIKISWFRGDSETWHHKNYFLSQPKLDALQYWYGPTAEEITFVVEETIPTEIEVAYDGPCVHGQFPSRAIHGYESKDKAYIAHLQKYDEMPKQVRYVNECFAPLLKRAKYAQMWGTEIRVDTEGQPFFTDATTRFPLPPGFIQLELFGNLPEIIWKGANGEFVDIKSDYEFACEVILWSRWAFDNWEPVIIPKKVRQWTKLIMPCQMGSDEFYICPGRERKPNPSVSEEIGSVIGLGNTIEEAAAHLKENLDEVQGYDAHGSIDALNDCLKSIHAAQEQGIEFCKQEVPERIDL